MVSDDAWAYRQKDVEIAARKMLTGRLRGDKYQEGQGMDDLRNAVNRLGSAEYRETEQERIRRQKLERIEGVFDAFFKPVLDGFAERQARAVAEAVFDAKAMAAQEQRNKVYYLRRAIQDEFINSNPYKAGTVRAKVWNRAGERAAQVVTDNAYGKAES